MNQQQFEPIVRDMERRYGKIREGDEDMLAGMLFPMEGNLLKAQRKYLDSHSRRLGEAILLARHTVKSRTDGADIDTEKYETVENIRLKDALLSAFAPLTNKNIKNDSYFRFLGGYIGKQVPNDDKMNYAVLANAWYTVKLSQVEEMMCFYVHAVNYGVTAM